LKEAPKIADTDIFDQINALSREEEDLYAAAADGSGLDEAQRQRLARIKVELDRCFDLLHQRQGRRDAGQDPNDVEARPANVVEGYEQ